MRKFTIISIPENAILRPHMSTCWGTRALFRYLNNNHLSKYQAVKARYVYNQKGHLVLEDHRTTRGIQRVAYDGSLATPKGLDLTLALRVEGRGDDPHRPSQA